MCPATDAYLLGFEKFLGISNLIAVNPPTEEVMQAGRMATPGLAADQLSLPAPHAPRRTRT